MIGKRVNNKEDMGQLILSTAMELFVAKGVEKTSIRNIAEKISCSPGTVYLYFKNKAEILHVLHSRGFKKLQGQFSVLGTVSNPMERLKALGKVYLNFAIQNPELYDLMFQSPSPMKHLDADNEELWMEGNKTFSVLKDTIKECIQKGYFVNHDIENLSFIMWSTVHGMASLTNSQRITKVKFSDPERIKINSYDEFMQMLEKF